MTTYHQPVACTLATGQAARQAWEWTDLQARSTSTTELSNGVRMHFPADLESRVMDLADREAVCCSFLTIETTVTDGELVLDLTSNNPEAKPVISMLAGTANP